jgi:hypothetical protein
MAGMRAQTSAARNVGQPGGRSRPVGVESGRRTQLAEVDERQVAAIERALASAGAGASRAHEHGQQWAERVRAGLSAVLEYLEEEPQLARLCLEQSAAAGPGACARREQLLAKLERVVDEGREGARLRPPPATAEAVVAGALGAIHARLLESGTPGLRDLLNPLMSFIVLPYLGAGASRSELSRV